MKLRRLLRAGLVAVAVVVLAAAGALAWLVTTESGARFALARALAATDGALGVATIAGSFSDELVLRGVRWRDPAREVEIDRVALRLGLAGLASGTLLIEEVDSSVVRYRPLAAAAAADSAGTEAAAAGSQAAFSLPLAVRVARASIGGVEIATEAEPVAVERIIFSGLAEDTTAVIQRFEARAYGFFVSLQGGLSWQDGLFIDALASWSGEIEGEPVLGSIDVNGSWPVLSIEQESLAPFEQTATGTVALAPAPAFDLEVDWNGLGRIEVAGGRDADSGSWQAAIVAEDLEPAALVPDWPGRLSLSATLAAELDDGYRIATDDLTATATLGEQTLSLEFAGAVSDPAEVEIGRLVARLGANRVELAGSIGQTLDLSLAAALEDMSAIAALASGQDVLPLEEAVPIANALSGRASADLDISGALRAPLVAGSVRLQDSSYAGLPLELLLDFATPAEGETAIRVERLEARLGASSLSGGGRIGTGIFTADGAADAGLLDAAVDLNATADFADLAELAALAGREEVRALIGRELPLAGLEGRARAELAIAGPAGQSTVNIDVGLSELSYERFRLETASLAAAFGLYSGSPVSVSLAATSEVGSLRLAAGGSVSGDSFVGSVAALDIEEQWLGSWNLRSPMGFAIGPGRIEIDSACLEHAATAICGEWRYGGDADRLRLAASDFDLGVLNPLLPPTVSLAGRVALAAELDSPTGVPAGNLSIAGERIDVAVAMSETDRVTTTLQTVAVNAGLDRYALEVAATIVSPTGGRAELTLTTADLRDREAAIGGNIAVEWPDLGALALLSPEIGEVGGNLAIGIDLAGTAASPELSGRAALGNGRIAVPDWGILVERIEAEAISPGGRMLEYTGTGYIEDRTIRISGVTDLDPAAGWPTRFDVTGDNVPVARRPDATVYASPDFDVTIRLPSIDVEGTVLIPEADISVEELPNQAVRVSPDSIVHGRIEEDEEIRPLEVSADVTVVLGDAVRYTGSNLDVVLAGSLRLGYQSGRSPNASGTVSLTGSYDAYGQSLTIDRGELLFAGALDDPALDVLAVREVGSTTVGLRLSGSLLAPEPSLFSDPPMSEANTLSYLMLGRPLSNSDDEETATLQSAALSLGLQQALPVVQRVGETLGLDELSIEMNEIDAGALMAGKYLSPNIYMSYSYGLFNRIGGFLLRYNITERLSLETRSGDEKSMDFLYSIEKE